MEHTVRNIFRYEIAYNHTHTVFHTHAFTVGVTYCVDESKPEKIVGGTMILQ